MRKALSDGRTPEQRAAGAPEVIWARRGMINLGGPRKVVEEAEKARMAAREAEEAAAKKRPRGAGGIVPTLDGHIPDAAKWIKNGGSVIYHSDGSVTYIKNGISIRYNARGFPDFSKYLYKGTEGLNEVRIRLTGSRRLDEIAANAKAGFKRTPDGYVWHHNEDAGLMQLVREDVHGDWWHSGGFSLNK